MSIAGEVLTRAATALSTFSDYNFGCLKLRESTCNCTWVNTFEHDTYVSIYNVRLGLLEL